MYSFAADPAPLAFSTPTSALVNAAPGGVVAVIWVSETTVTSDAWRSPKVTVLTPASRSWNPVPVIVTAVPPCQSPAGGSTAVTVGIGL